MKLKVEYVPIEDLKPYENNAKIHTEEQVEQIKKSIQEFGMNDPIGIWGKDNLIVEGHGRLMACKELGFNEVPVIRLDDLTDDQRRAYTLIHNQTTMNTGFDLDILNEELASIDLDMSDFGFDEIELDDIEEEKEIVEDEVPEVPEEPKAKLGDIYQLGNHRLMCGDSTSEKDVAKLMNNERAKILFTSPPYSDMREYNGGKDFLKCNNLFDGDILTNPPYKYAKDFVKHSLDLLEDGNYCIMYLKIQFLEGKDRRKLFDKFPPKYVYVNSARQTCYINGNMNKKMSSASCYCWYIWEKGFKGEPIIRWI